MCDKHKERAALLTSGTRHLKYILTRVLWGFIKIYINLFTFITVLSPCKQFEKHELGEYNQP